MQFGTGSRLDPSQVRVGGGGGRMILGGGAGLIVLVVALVLGVDPNALLGGGQGAGGVATGANPYAACSRGSDIAADRQCRFVAYTNSIQAYWADAYPDYQKTYTTIFSGQVQTACGSATAAVGPFYCPNDKVVYLDTGFFDELSLRFGAKGGDAAEAYVIAHEYGHHIQNLTGTFDRVKSRETGPASPGVRLELQADCYAGVWMAHAATTEGSPVTGVTAEDLATAADAAVAVGDDRIQQGTSGRIDRESWTHGSSAQRKRWLTTGFTSGDPARCDTFAATDLG